jgi:hypothetical protein
MRSTRLPARPIDDAGYVRCPLLDADIDHERCGSCGRLVRVDVDGSSRAVAIVCRPESWLATALGSDARFPDR